ncbi:MAG: methionyl-tRNA formyltransferase [Pseudomonadota bacterium]
MPAFSGKKFPARPRLIFMGTPDFAVPTLESLMAFPHGGLTVVTQPDKRKGRGKKIAQPPIKMLALENHIEVLQPEKISDRHFRDTLKNKDPDLIIVVAFGRVLPKELLAIPEWGVINTHASLLPKYRGAAPIQWAVLNDEPKTGLTIMRMDEGLDTGPILLRQEVEIREDETAGHLHDRLAVSAGEFMTAFLNRLSEKPLEERPQENTEASYAPKIGRQLSLIDWNLPARRISALIRALDPRPGACTTWQERQIKVFASRVVENHSTHARPGRVIKIGGGGLIVETAEGAVELRELQVSGKKKLPADDFIRGFPLPEGAILGR